MTNRGIPCVFVGVTTSFGCKCHLTYRQRNRTKYMPAQALRLIGHSFPCELKASEIMEYLTNMTSVTMNSVHSTHAV